MTNATTSRPVSPWLIRISKNFEHLAGDIIADVGATLTKRIGDEYYLLKCPNPDALNDSDAAVYIRWKLPMDHAWPCRPERMEHFVEKAAQALHRKFSGRQLQGTYVGLLDANARNHFYKALATKLGTRTLEFFESEAAGFKDPEDQAPDGESLFCMVGKEGLYCGVGRPLDVNGFYPGGTKFISQKAPHMISRAGAKIAEALHYLTLYRPLPASGAHWLELGACPGGMTSELLERGYRVTAIDRAPLDGRLDGRKGLSFKKADVTRYHPSPQVRFDALLCDMNGDVGLALGNVIRLAKSLCKGALIVYTLKTPGATSYQETNQLFHQAIAMATEGGFHLIASTHLTYNRHEFTLFFENGTKR